MGGSQLDAFSQYLLAQHHAGFEDSIVSITRAISSRMGVADTRHQRVQEVIGHANHVQLSSLSMLILILKTAPLDLIQILYNLRSRLSGFFSFSISSSIYFRACLVDQDSFSKVYFSNRSSVPNDFLHPLVPPKKAQVLTPKSTARYQQ